MNEERLSKCIGEIDAAFIEETERFRKPPKHHSYWKKLIIKWGITILGTGILLLVLLVWPSRDYALIQENGTYYICIDKKYICDRHIEFHHDGMSETQIYDSLDSMEKQIRNGTFTAKEFYWLGCYADEDGKIPIFDLDHMKDARFPEDISHYIVFSPAAYKICGKGENGITNVTMCEITEKEFHSQLQKAGHFSDAIEITDWSQSLSDPRDIIPIIDAYTVNYRFYVIVTEDVRYYVHEIDQFSVDAPYRYLYDIWGQTKEGVFFELKINFLETQPDLDWLTTFRLIDRT